MTAGPSAAPRGPIVVPLWPGRARPVMRIYVPDGAREPLPAMVVFSNERHVAFTMFPRGAHGLGLALGQPGPLGQWTTQLLGWLAARWPAR